MSTPTEITPKLIADLEAEIRYHSRLYYDMNKPEVSDDDFDVLFDRLQRWAPNSPVLNERSQDAFDDDFKHAVPMGSQAKCKTQQELLDKFLGYTVTCTPKLDGAGLALHYNHGRLVLAVTRGRTETGKGKIVTPNSQEINGIPKTIPFLGKAEIRGEVVIFNSSFFGTMDQPGYDGRPDGYANPRNAASGGLTCRDIRETKARDLNFVPYKVITESVQSHQHEIQLLSRWGLNPPPCIVRTVNGQEDIEYLVEEGRKWREDQSILDYNIDGIVVRINDETDYQAKGMSGVCPNGSAAYKYQAVREETVLNDVEWVTNRTGIVHPTGCVDTVNIDGSNVSRVTLNNPTWMKQFPGLGIGARVELEKCNDIIPGLVAVVVPSPDGDTKQPIHCPSCGTELGYEFNSDGSEGVRLKCPNKADCPAQFHDSILHMLRKLEIKGISDATIDRIIAAGLVYSPADMFTISAGELESAGFKKREGEVVLEALADVKVPSANILASVGVDFWGRRMAQKLIKNSSAFTEERLLEADFDYDELVAVPEVGPAKAKALCKAFGSADDPDPKWARKLLNELLDRVSVETSEPVEAPADSQVAGKTFCLSGTMPRGKKAIEADIVAASGVMKSGVSKSLSYLVAGPGSGSKSKKAEAAGVTIITEDELYEMLGK